MFSDFHFTHWMRKFFFQSLLSAERATGGTLTDRPMEKLFTHHLLLHCTFYWDLPFQTENSVQCKTEKRHSFVSAERHPRGFSCCTTSAKSCHKGQPENCVWFTHSMSMFRGCWFDKWKFYFIYSSYVFKLYGRSLCSDKKWKNSSKLEIL